MENDTFCNRRNLMDALEADATDDIEGGGRDADDAVDKFCVDISLQQEQVKGDFSEDEEENEEAIKLEFEEEEVVAFNEQRDFHAQALMTLHQSVQNLPKKHKTGIQVWTSLTCQITG